MTQPDPRSRTAIVLFNLGGPDSLKAVKPFLLNLFSDPAILRVPFFVRPLLARIIARARNKPATENYKLLGGKSPLLALTRQQADALSARLREGGNEVECFIAMRYWHPFAADTVARVKAFKPDRVLLLPLYPQYSTTTTGSSLTDWRERAAAAGLVAPTTTLCCWHSDERFVDATASLLERAIRAVRREAGEDAKLRILFSAHGLPETIVERGDPYQFQIERNAAAILHALARRGVRDQALTDTVVCYQSRATPQKWLDPSTDHEIERAGRDGIGLIVVPIAFVSEHSETLVELDIEYQDLAVKCGVPVYRRVPTQNDDPGFIDALASLAADALARGPGLCSFRGGGVCPARFGDCPHVRAGSRSGAS